jgi:hypothetical protein
LKLNSTFVFWILMKRFTFYGTRKHSRKAREHSS